MFDFIPLKYYFDVYIYFAFFLVIANLLHAYTVDLESEKNIKFLRSSGYALLVLVILYLGLRPLSVVFGDMGSYYYYFRDYSRGSFVTIDKDILFHYYMKFLSYFISSKGFFLITMFLYVLPFYLISKVHFKQLWFYGFFMFLVSFSFYSYGVNGMRNGLATSMFLWGLCFYKNKVKLTVFFIIAIFFHKTLLLPVMAYFISGIYNNPKFYLKGWLLSIPLSLFMGGVFITLFTILGFGDDRMAGYLTGQMDGDSFSSIGFRWDFLFYSAFPVFAGWYFIIKKKFNDIFYNNIFSTYLICNGFWILVIRANFSNRFAYLSWFMMAIIIIYPLLKQQFFVNQKLMIAKVVTAYFMFTYLMSLIYYS